MIKEMLKQIFKEINEIQENQQFLFLLEIRKENIMIKKDVEGAMQKLDSQNINWIIINKKEEEIIQ